MTHKIGKKSCPWRGLFAVFLEEVGDAEVLGVVVALKVVDAEGFHLVGHFFCFYAFGGDHEAQGMGVRIFFWTILVVLTLSLSFLCILLDSCRPR